MFASQWRERELAVNSVDSCVYVTNLFVTIDPIQNGLTSFKTGHVHAAVYKVIQMCE